MIETLGSAIDDRLHVEPSVSELFQSLSVGILEQQDEERRWIATQLHEVMAQNVSTIALYLASLQQKKSSPSAIRFTLAKCQVLCEQSLEQILALSRLLHPLIVDELGLAACLRQYTEEFMKRSGIQVVFEAGPDTGRFPLKVETHLFRVAQEGLSNILQHSESLHAIVRLRREADQVILQIEDFGRGMTASAMSSGQADNPGKRGLGILGMQERLRNIGGRLEIRSSSQGTTLTASIRL